MALRDHSGRRGDEADRQPACRLGAGVGVTVRVCIEAGCPALTRKTRCHEHERAKDRERGTSGERGYDYAHQQERAAWAPLVATGNVKCWRCGEYITAGAAFDLGHDDADRSKYRGPEHVGCNRAAPRISRGA